MHDAAPFALHDCGLARMATGQSCSNLRELLAAVRTAPDEVLEHHMLHCVLEDHFEMHEFPNDLARWCWDALGDHALGEQLGLVDPYREPSVAALRATLIDVIERRLWTTETVPTCRPGLELHLIASRLVYYDTGERFESPAVLAEAMHGFSLRSLFLHVHEARRRSGGLTDDFSAWLEARDAEPALVKALRAIDFYFLNLKELRHELIAVFRRFMPDSPAIVGVAA